ncbi:MAG: AsmA-like C-terminal region-containing protein [Hyphomicrobiaceae bacterium]|nr:AsmA-like C-terminal region-containing protein [Hyphomicrobiaceae bacterium]
MKRNSQTRRAIFASFGILACALAVVALPIIFSTERNDLTIRGSTLMAADQHHYLITTPIALDQHREIVIASGTVALDNSSGLTSQGVLDALLRGSGRLVLKDGEVVVRTARPSSEDNARPADTVLGAPFAAALGKLGFKSIALRGTTVRLEATDGTADVLEDVDAVVTLSGIRRFAAAGSFRYRGQKLEFTSSLDANRGAHPDQRLPIRASFKGELIEATIAGDLMPGNGGRLLAPEATVRVSDVGRAARWLGMPWPLASKLASFSGRGTLDWSAHTIAFQDAQFRFDQNQASGVLAINYRQAKPKIDGTLAFATLDLSKYLKPPASDDLISATVRRTAAWLPDGLGLGLDDIALPLLNQIEADVRLSADKIGLGAVTLGRGAATLTVRDGVMLADVAELEIDDKSNGNLQVTVDATGPVGRYGIRGKLEGFDIGVLSKALIGAAALRGAGTVSIDLETTGETPEEFVAALSGRITAEAPAGIEVAADVVALAKSADAGTLSAGPRASGWGEAVRSSTMTQDTRITARFARGHMTLETCRAKTGGVQVIATGTADLAERSVDLRLWVDDRPVPPAAGAQAASDPVAGTLVTIEGDWREPRIGRSRHPSRSASPMGFIDTEPSLPASTGSERKPG